MIARLILAIVLYIEDIYTRWRDRRIVERAQDDQKRNDSLDRGDADAISRRMRDRAERD